MKALVIDFVKLEWGDGFIALYKSELYQTIKIGYVGGNVKIGDLLDKGNISSNKVIQTIKEGKIVYEKP